MHFLGARLRRLEELERGRRRRVAHRQARGGGARDVQRDRRARRRERAGASLLRIVVALGDDLDRVSGYNVRLLAEILVDRTRPVDPTWSARTLPWRSRRLPRWASSPAPLSRGRGCPRWRTSGRRPRPLRLPRCRLRLPCCRPRLPCCRQHPPCCHPRLRCCRPRLPRCRLRPPRCRQRLPCCHPRLQTRPIRAGIS